MHVQTALALACLTAATHAFALPQPDDSVRITGDETDSVRITGDTADSVRITRDIPEEETDWGRIKRDDDPTDETDSVRITDTHWRREDEPEDPELGHEWGKVKTRDEPEEGSEWN